ncbi:hypothetical protein BC831DRAFT_451003 [Entophlyctis helioformis]|nr:hypothetical protein BC831DRAFT_451003 [Entophlyctis helioformis]
MLLVWDPVDVNLWLVQLAIPVLVLLFFASVRHTSIPPPLAAVAVSAVALSIPLVIQRHSGFYGFLWNVLLAHAIFTAFRTVSMSFMPRSLLSVISLPHFVECFVTFETPQTRALEEAQLRKRLQQAAMAVAKGDRSQAAARRVARLQRSISSIVPRSKQTWTYAAGVAIKVAVNVLVVALCLSYLVIVPANDPIPEMRLFMFDDAKFGIDLVVFYALFYSLLQVAYTSTFHVWSVVLNVPFRPIMDSPFLATSLRDFWSFRWNHIVQKSLRDVAFVPVLGQLRRINPPPTSRSSASPPMWHVGVACICTFLLSAALHEQANDVGEGAFFLVHGGLVVAEMVVGSLCLRVLRFNPIEETPKWISAVPPAAADALRSWWSAARHAAFQ